MEKKFEFNVVYQYKDIFRIFIHNGLNCISKDKRYKNTIIIMYTCLMVFCVLICVLCGYITYDTYKWSIYIYSLILPLGVAYNFFGTMKIRFLKRKLKCKLLNVKHTFTFYDTHIVEKVDNIEHIIKYKEILNFFTYEDKYVWADLKFSYYCNKSGFDKEYLSEFESFIKNKINL